MEPQSLLVGSSSTVMAHDCSNGNTGTSNTNGNTGTSTTNGNTAMAYDCSNGNTSITIMANSSDSATSYNIGIINSPTEVMYLSLSELLVLQVLSYCRRNFAANCAKRIFSEDERLESNVNGKSGKKKLDENKIKFIESAVF